MIQTRLTLLLRTLRKSFPFLIRAAACCSDALKKCVRYFQCFGHHATVASNIAASSTPRALPYYTADNSRPVASVSFTRGTVWHLISKTAHQLSQICAHRTVVDLILSVRLMSRVVKTVFMVLNIHNKTEKDNRQDHKDNCSAQSWAVLQVRVPFNLPSFLLYSSSTSVI